ncbi:MAG: cell division protein FtsA [Bacteroidetes bacterium]|jgi:cell division protein FtsA|nr:cell division protein FtsA [Bacteroidota bacterium]MBT3423613.1 cell division protein FtsA [Bacteroidota bacterium]MBT3800994.1 cell division protein FtsA [Bacteroidota bacterium]MBT3933379.1 cell division protein FtsA [Bacteroidota bacterium]MBT4338495.1 cell division protein FtsA [Bacteroidota bacterium]
MKEKEIIVGLDIGTTKIAAIVGERAEGGKINIMGVGLTETRDAVLRGVVVNIDRTVDAIKQAVSEASKKSDVNIKVVHVGIAGQHIKCLHHRGQITRNNGEDEISKVDLDRLIHDMHKVVLDPGEEIIHIIPQDYIIDNDRGIKDPIGISGVRLEGNFHIITGQVTATKNIDRCVVRANLEVAELVLEPIASAEAVLNEEEKEAGVALIDIGGGTTDLAIFQDGIIRHTAVIPLGGEIITNDIKEGCNVMQKQAEMMKVKFGSALANEARDNEIISIPGIRGRDPREISVKNLAHIIQARMEEIFEHIHFEIKSSGFEKKLQGGIVLTGGGSQLKHLPQLVEYVTGIDARIGYPTEHLSKGLISEVRNPLFATGIGLVLHGAKTPIKSGNEEKVEKTKKTGLFGKVKHWLEDGQDDFKE